MSQNHQVGTLRAEPSNIHDVRPNKLFFICPTPFQTQNKVGLLWIYTATSTKTMQEGRERESGETQTIIWFYEAGSTSCYLVVISRNIVLSDCASYFNVHYTERLSFYLRISFVEPSFIKCNYFQTFLKMTTRHQLKWHKNFNDVVLCDA